MPRKSKPRRAPEPPPCVEAPIADQTSVAHLPLSDRPAVLNRRWRGAFPKNVINMRAAAHWVYLKPGDEAMVCGSADHGKRVRIVECARPETRKRLNLDGRADRWFLAEAIVGRFEEMDEPSKRAIFAAKWLRRVPKA